MNNTDSNEQIPQWVGALILGLTEANERFVGVVKTIQERQDILEARLDGKSEKEKAASEEVTPEQIKDVCEKLFI